MVKTYYRRSMVLAMFLLAAIMTGCDNPLASNLENGDKYFKAGDYAKAIDFYLKAAEEYNTKLGKTYMNKDDAKADAMKLAEIYMKSGLTYEKLKNDAQARAMFEKAAKDSQNITFGWYENQQVHVEGKYENEWMPGYYKDVYIDGGYTKQYVDGYYESKQVYVDGYYEGNVYHDGYYKSSQVWHDGYYKDVYVAGHYEKSYVDGYWTKKWVPAHYDTVAVLKTKSDSVPVASVYIDQAKAKLTETATAAKPTGTRISDETTASAAAAPAEAANTELAMSVGSPDKKEAYDKMTSTYRAWIDAGAPQDGTMFSEYSEAKKAYDALAK
jgi:hypothetical protein